MANKLNHVSMMVSRFEESNRDGKPFPKAVPSSKPPLAPKPKIKLGALADGVRKSDDSISSQERDAGGLNGVSEGRDSPCGPEALPAVQRSREEDQCSCSHDGSRRASSSSFSSAPEAEEPEKPSEEEAEAEAEANEGEEEEAQEPEVPGQQKTKNPQHVIDEIVTTERKFVEDLVALRLCYDAMTAANEQQSLGLEKAITDIFSDFHQIHQLHANTFLPKMEEQYATSTEPWIGRFFVEHSYIMKTYKPFIVRQEENKELLIDLLKHPEIKAAIETVLKDDMRLRLGFFNVYNVVFQRITRYPTLLKEYLKRLPDDCPDCALAEAAMVKVTRETHLTNEIKRDVENFHTVLLTVLDKIIDGRQIPLQAWERFVKEGTVWKISARRMERLRERYLFLFSGRLLVCTQSMNHYQVRYSMGVTSMQILDIKDPDRHPNSYRVKTKERILDLKFASHEEAEEWHDTLARVINEDRQRKLSFMNAGGVIDNAATLGKQAPEWIKDEQCSMCMHCSVKFTVTNRRHHCRACGRLVCGSCSPYKHPLEYRGGSIERICKSCKEVFDSGLAAPTLPDVAEKPPASKYDETRLEEKLGFAEGKRPFKDCFVQLHTEGSIFIFNKIKDVKPIKTIPIVGFSLTRWGEVERCFRLSHPSCEYFFTARTEEQLTAWIEKIQEVLDGFAG